MVTAIPDVSVVIPTRNRWDLLSRSGLSAALMQTGVNLEIIVVDDGSTDDTPARLAALESEDPRVRVIRHDERQGVSRARNRGIAEARAEWLAFLDDDDLWSPDKLRRQLDLARRTRAGFVYGSAIVLDGRRNVLRLLESPQPTALPEHLARQNVVPAGQSNVLARTDAVRRLGGFDDQLALIADWDMWIRLAHAEQAAACDDILVAYVLHSEGMQVLESDASGARAFAYLTNKHGLDVAERRTAAVLWARWRGSVYRRAGRRMRASREYLGSALADRNLGMLARGVAVLFGEAAMRRGHGHGSLRSVKPPAWLSLYPSRD
jgi:glycosyltransferase involved in cell wall biosynthesis